MLRNKICLSVSLMLFLFISCKKSDVTEKSDPQSNQIFSFSFKANNNSQLQGIDIECTFKGDTITGIVPYLDVSSESLVASFTVSPGVVVTVNSKVQVADSTTNDYSTPLVYTVHAGKLPEKEYVVCLKRFTGLPILYINTENSQPVTSKEDYSNAQLRLVSNGLNFPDFEGTAQIRGRGNTTWGMPKKPYKIKLAKKAELLGMPADREWVLLANYIDKSLMRNRIAFMTSQIFDMRYTPGSQFVEVVFNGSYEGNYLLTDHLKIAADRVNIIEMENEDVSGENLTGGYRLEVDAALDEENWFITTRGMPVTIKEPDAGVPEQNEYITNYVQATEDVLFSPGFTNDVNGYSKYLDAETFINWFWVNELFKNNDAIFHTSVFMYKDRNGPLSMGPVWDFDVAAGNINFNDNDKYEGWWVKNATWISRLFEDPAFAQKAVNAWKRTRSQLILLPSIIDQTASYLDLSQKENFRRWEILDKYIAPNAVVTGSYKEEVAYFKNWLIQRILWIDSNVDQLAL